MQVPFMQESASVMHAHTVGIVRYIISIYALFRFLRRFDLFRFIRILTSSIDAPQGGQ